jgi:hypothetical protein
MLDTRKLRLKQASRESTLYSITLTLESGIDVGQGINIGPGKLDKNNKCMALNKYRAWKIRQKKPRIRNLMIIKK